MSMPEAGQPAPALSGPTQDGAFDLSAHRGRWAIVYFYPKDSTPGCTTEACDFRDAYAALSAADAVVVGVSRDSVKRHQGFAGKFELPFPLVADDDGTITEAWGVWQEKKNYGRSYMGIVRSTFLVDPDGKIAHAWPSVRVKGHVADVRETLARLQG
ncbi:MAG: peroxiredoxin [Alphaproteobacteria bacterium]|nr:peroxiredoxin [Alphaproteobacteria bacterium]